ncbi:NHL repeat-containing protein [Saccharicrinis fermentans]|uniref:Uncharacterized protein n=1 Tax=Saccharicrinis fermentans DSM 9555 = JCM 21142 TaxID=869213 RepID=W7Y9W0_9BACT|nr:hypothetical protein [Saccharicrinis fermentans]GAF04318.1 hypothetical protein JCM21142_73019 [Saccharicrinis fermentans DSM 9555 = JCM 21142]
MKKLFLLIAIIPFLFSSCEEDNETNKNTETSSFYIVNYGNYGGTKGSLSSFNLADSTINNYVYESINGVAMTGNPQYVYNYDGNIYVMGNNKDEVYYFDNVFLEQTENGVSTDIVKPRYCVGNGDYLYISCWGGDIWEDTSLSYIAKYNLKEKIVEKKIALAGGPEGLEIANGKLYCALNYEQKVAIMDLNTETFSYIDLPAATSYFLKDNSNNLYVSMISTFTHPSTETGMGYINTQTDELETTYTLSGISTGYSSIMAANSDFSKIYIIASSWIQDTNDEWIQVGGLQTFDVASQTYEAEPFVSNVNGLNGVAVNPETDDVFCMISESTSTSGKLQMYNKDKTLIKTLTTGIAPAWALFIQ